MPNINDLKQSKFLSQKDVTSPILVTVRGFEQVNVAKEGAPQEDKWVLNFDETDKPLVLNATNGQIIAKITGAEDFEGWIGKKLVLYFDPNVSFAGKLTGGIRVRAPRIPAAQPKPAPKPVAPEPQDQNQMEQDDVPF